jgi:hypothetical protein
VVRETVNPLKVAVVVKNTPAAFRREDRSMGMWSYDVPEFTWEFMHPGKHFTLDTPQLKRRGFDLIFHEDGGAWGRYAGRAIPTIYYAIDSTLSDENHYQPRLKQARQADLILVDHDRLERFAVSNRTTARLSYCVNNRLFKPSPDARAIDVSFHCGGDEYRASYRNFLNIYAKRHGWTYSSGTLPLEQYARQMANSKVVVNVPRNLTNRPHRFLDAMACKACLLTQPFALMADETFDFNGCYELFTDADSLETQLVALLEDGGWKCAAEKGYQTVMQNHTWAWRARELRTIIHKEFSI